MITIFKGTDGKTHIAQSVSVAKTDTWGVGHGRHVHRFTILPLCAGDVHEVEGYEHAVCFSEFDIEAMRCAECAADFLHRGDASASEAIARRMK